MENTQSMETQPYAPTIPEAQVQDAFSWTGLISTIIIFLILLWLVLWLIKRINRKGYQGIQTTWLRVLDRQSLSPQHNIYLVEVAGKIQIWGSTEHQINQITEINSTSQISDILEEIAQRPEDPVDKLIRYVLPRRPNLNAGQRKEGHALMNLGRRGKRKNKNSFSCELEKLLQDDDKY